MKMEMSCGAVEVVFPSYYQQFKCIAGACKHSCCIGWEIGIDADTAERYRAVSGEIGARLREEIVWEETPCFRMGKDGRCPFLNEDNLCDLILGLGEESLCGICREHPRFYNELPGRCEIGLGLCCEEAARLVLSQAEAVHLKNEPETQDELLLLRAELFAVLQDRTNSIEKRVAQMLACCDTALPQRDWHAFLLSLERLDPVWEQSLEYLNKPADLDGFDAYMRDRQTEYEQLLVYLLYRHFATAFDLRDAAARACFAALAYRVLHRIGAAVWTEKGAFSVEDQVEFVRQFSSEIEYSEENLDRVLDELYT